MLRRAAGGPWRLSAGCAISLQAGHVDTQTGFPLFRLLAETQECACGGETVGLNYRFLSPTLQFGGAPPAPHSSRSRM